MYFEDFERNCTIPIPPAQIEKEEMLDFALKYDNVPLHTDEAYAKTTHFGRLLTPGFLSFLAVWSKYLEVDKFGQELLAGKSSKIEWFKPVFAGDVLTGRAVVTNLTQRNEKNGIVEMTIYVYNQHGELVLMNTTEAIVKCRRDKAPDSFPQ